MTADLQLISDTWSALEAFTRVEKCAACECLQGALVELRMALEELAKGTEQERLLAAVSRAMKVQSPHRCLGCEPCNPSDVLASFYRAQQAREVVSPCACEDG
jgi:hypothetical protein